MECVNLFLHQLRVRVNRLLQSIDHNIRRLQKCNLELSGNRCLKEISVIETLQVDSAQNFNLFMKCIVKTINLYKTVFLSKY